MKKCSRCGMVKPHASFYRDASTRDGRQSRCAACQREVQAAYSKSPKGKQVQRRSSRKMRLRQKYGLTPEQYEQMRAEQGGCAICGRDDETLCVDHDHTTGEVRGLLCSRCNRGLGLLGDHLSGLQSAVRYLADRSPSSEGTRNGAS